MNVQVNGAIYVVDDEFVADLEALLNTYSIDAQAETPDFLLAEFMVEQLVAYIRVRHSTLAWLGGKAKLSDGWTKPDVATGGVA